MLELDSMEFSWLDIEALKEMLFKLTQRKEQNAN
jgi:hypothetical protein